MSSQACFCGPGTIPSRSGSSTDASNLTRSVFLWTRLSALIRCFFLTCAFFLTLDERLSTTIRHRQTSSFELFSGRGGLKVPVKTHRTKALAKDVF